ncbi:MAG TPA: hypothetical protein VNH13_05390 [Candidatus Acidoferrales bacterium]|nr:hypothetical protein [Candidatus Acidoferrales bacterium]
MTRRSNLAALTAAVLLVVALAGAWLGVGPLGAGGPGTSGLGASPDGASSAAAGGFPPTVAGLPTHSVIDALGIRASGSNERIAVGGWFVAFAVPCPMTADAVQPLEDCGTGFSWLMALPERLDTTLADGSGSIRQPAGPAFNVVGDLAHDGIVRAVVVIGHFHDAAASRCPAGERRQRCESRFVVESVAWLGPTAPPGAGP